MNGVNNPIQQQHQQWYQPPPRHPNQPPVQQAHQLPPQQMHQPPPQQPYRPPLQHPQQQPHQQWYQPPVQQPNQPPIQQAHQPPPQQMLQPPFQPPLQQQYQPPVQHPQQQPHQQTYQQPLQQQFQPSPYYSSMAPQPPRQMKPQLDQHAMPSAAQLINDELVTYQNSERTLNFTAPASLPPLVTTLESQTLKMSLQDGGCVRPCHMRSTIYQVPVSKDLLDTSGLEFSVVVKPFDDGEVERRYITPLSGNQIVRCNRCKAYINPFSRNGSCCICNLAVQGLQDTDTSHELRFGSYEFRVSQEYYRDRIAESRVPHIIFAIEMTANSRNLVHHLSRHLANVIENDFPSDFLYSGDKSILCPLVGFVTYNSKVTIHDVKNGCEYELCDMTTVTDCAPTSNFLVHPIRDFEKIQKFLALLPEMCNSAELEQQCVLGPVIEAAFSTCRIDKSNNYPRDTEAFPNQKIIPTGKTYLFHCSLPTYGDEKTPGRLGMKRNINDMKKHLRTDTESKALAADGTYYTQLAQKCINDYASGAELFLFPPEKKDNSSPYYLNIATIGELARITGTGIIRKYYMSSLDNFTRDLRLSLRSTVAFDASMRIRTSTGISPVRYIGNFNNTLGSNLEMSAVNTNSNFVVQMKYDDKIPEYDLVVVQFAMIYTSLCGERRVRVHNLALQTCQALGDLYKSACCDTLVNVLVRDSVDKMRIGTLTPKSAKEQLVARVISILAAYRKHCTDNQPGNSSQLILPEGLKLLPVYLCGALKCDAIDGGMDMPSPDDKVLAQLNLLGALPMQSQATVYPRMYSIAACDADDESNEYGLSAVLTRCYNLAIEEEKGQCYVLENGHYLFIFFPRTELGQSFLANVFGSHKDDPSLTWDMRQRETKESKFFEELLEQIVLERKRSLEIYVVRQGRDMGGEAVFKSFLYEDKKRPDGAGVTSRLDNPSYVDVLCYLHTEIRARLAQ